MLQATRSHIQTAGRSAEMRKRPLQRACRADGDP